MSETTTVGVAERNRLGQAEAEVLSNNIKDAFRRAEAGIVKEGQKVPVAFREKNKGFVVVLNPDVVEKDKRQVALDPANEYLLSDALVEVYRDRKVTGLTVNGVIGRTGMQGERVEDFLREDYRRIQRTGEAVTGEWVLESEVGKLFKKVLQVELNRPGKYETQWSIVGKTNEGWVNLPIEGGVA